MRRFPCAFSFARLSGRSTSCIFCRSRRGNGSLRPIFGPLTIVVEDFCALYSSRRFSSVRIGSHSGQRVQPLGLRGHHVVVELFGIVIERDLGLRRQALEVERRFEALVDAVEEAGHLDDVNAEALGERLHRAGDRLALQELRVKILLAEEIARPEFLRVGLRGFLIGKVLPVFKKCHDASSFS